MTVRIMQTPGEYGSAVVRCDGVVTGRELIEVNDLISTEPHQRYQLWDFTDADYIAISFDEIHKLAIQDSSIPDESGLQAILVVGTHRSLRNLVETFDRFSSKWVGRRGMFQVVLLETVKDARAWLEANLGIAEIT